MEPLTRSSSSDTLALENEPLTQTSRKESHFKVTLVCFVISFCGFCLGWDIGVVGSILHMPDFQTRFAQYHAETNTYEFGNIRTGLISGFYNLGALVGCLTLPLLLNKIGKRKNLAIGVVIYIVGNVIYITSVDKWYQVFVARLVMGFCLGGLSVLAPSIVADIAPLKIRGTLLSFYQILSCFGLASGYVFSYGTSHINGVWSWRTPMLVSFLWQSFMLVGAILLPESPAFLLQKGKVQELMKSLRQLHSGKSESEIEDLLAGIQSDLKSDTDGKVDLKYLFTGKPKIFLRLVTGVLIQFFQGVTGINYFFYYGTTIFEGIGMTNQFIPPMILSSVYAVSCFFSFPITARFKRKTITLAGSFFTVLFLLIFVLLTKISLYPNGEENGASTITGKFVIMISSFYVFNFAVGWGPMGYILMNEILPLRLNKIGVGFAMASNWLTTLFVTFCTPMITAKIGFMYGAVFMISSLVGGIFIWLFVPETKGYTFREIDEIYANNKLFWKEKKPTPTIDISMSTFKASDFNIEEAQNFDIDATPMNDFATTDPSGQMDDYFSSRV